MRKKGDQSWPFFSQNLCPEPRHVQQKPRAP